MEFKSSVKASALSTEDQWLESTLPIVLPVSLDEIFLGMENGFGSIPNIGSTCSDSSMAELSSD
jgi:hypothetical protein